MSIMGVAGFALFAAALILCLKELRGSGAVLLRAAAVIVLFGGALSLLAPLLSRLTGLFSDAGAAGFAGVLLRALGIGLLAELAAALCRDLGENSLGEGVAFFGKLEILLLALPFAEELLEIAKEFLKW